MFTIHSEEDPPEGLLELDTRKNDGWISYTQNTDLSGSPYIPTKLKKVIVPRNTEEQHRQFIILAIRRLYPHIEGEPEEMIS